MVQSLAPLFVSNHLSPEEIDEHYAQHLNHLERLRMDAHARRMSGILQDDSQERQYQDQIDQFVQYYARWRETAPGLSAQPILVAFLPKVQVAPPAASEGSTAEGSTSFLQTDTAESVAEKPQSKRGRKKKGATELVEEKPKPKRGRKKKVA